MAAKESVTPPGAPGNLLVINRTYDLVKWSCQHIAKFPRSQRVTLGDRLELRLYAVRQINEIGQMVGGWIKGAGRPSAPGKAEGP